MSIGVLALTGHADRGWPLKLSYIQESGAYAPLPSWAKWLFHLGQTMASLRHVNGVQQTVVVTVPDRRFGALFVGLGAVSIGMRRHLPSVDSRFADMVPHESFLTWIDANREIRFGRFEGIENSEIRYLSRRHVGWSGPWKRPIHQAHTFWPAQASEEFVDGKPSATNLKFVDNVLRGNSDAFLASSCHEFLIIGTKTDLENELRTPCFVSDGERGSLNDLLRPRQTIALGQRSKGELLSSSLSLEHADFGDTPIAIIDGPQGYLRLRDQVRSPAVVVILDRWQHRSAEAAQAAMIDRNTMWVDHSTPAFEEPPPGIELYAWACKP